MEVTFDVPQVRSGDFSPLCADAYVLTFELTQDKRACNFFVSCVADMLGYHGLDGMTASRMVRFMQTKGWLISRTQAMADAAKGDLVIGGLTAAQIPEATMGHVNIVRPGSVKAYQWGGIYVPKCANVSISPDPNLTFHDRGEDYAFPKLARPEYFHVPLP